MLPWEPTFPSFLGVMSYDPYIRWLGEPRIILKRDGEWQFTKKNGI